MNALGRAWDEFLQAIKEAHALAAAGGEPHEIAELVRYARELVDIIEDAITAQPIAIPGAAGAVLVQLRGRLRSLERDVMPARH